MRQRQQRRNMLALDHHLSSSSPSRAVSPLRQAPAAPTCASLAAPSHDAVIAAVIVLRLCLFRAQLTLSVTRAQSPLPVSLSRHASRALLSCAAEQMTFVQQCSPGAHALNRESSSVCPSSNSVCFVDEVDCDWLVSGPQDGLSSLEPLPLLHMRVAR